MIHDRASQIRMTAGGRIVIPAALRAALGVGPGDQLVATLVDGEVRLTTMAERIRRLQQLVRDHDRGSGSVVDELIADRRTEAARG